MKENQFHLTSAAGILDAFKALPGSEFLGQTSKIGLLTNTAQLFFRRPAKEIQATCVVAKELEMADRLLEPVLNFLGKLSVLCPYNPALGWG